jgi:uncharacterized membrane protein
MKRTYRDPMIGDELTLGEYLSWKIQGVMRNWYFLTMITITTIIVWSTNNDIALTWWNLAASYLALVIESIVGLAMFNQCKRDAVIIREIRAISQRINTAVDKSNIIHEQTYKLAQQIDTIVEHEQQDIEQIVKGKDV